MMKPRLHLASIKHRNFFPFACVFKISWSGFDASVTAWDQIRRLKSSLADMKKKVEIIVRTRKRETLMNFSGISTFFSRLLFAPIFFYMPIVCTRLWWITTTRRSQRGALSVRYGSSTRLLTLGLLLRALGPSTKVKDMCLKWLESSLVANFFLLQLFFCAYFSQLAKMKSSTDNLFTW